MAKISFNKLGIKSNIEVVSIIFNEQEIEVKKYLPLQQKLQIIQNTINNSLDEYKFCNTLKVEAFFTLEVMYSYTNINFTDTQKKDPAKLYDLVVSSGLFNEIIKAIGKEEYVTLMDALWKTVNGIYSQMNSVYGIMEGIVKDYSNTSFDASVIQEKLSDPNNMKLVKDILKKMG